MTKLARLTGRRAISSLQKAGFAVLRMKGSRHFLRHEDGRATVVPVHRGEIIGPGMPSQILRDCELTREKFLTLPQGREQRP